MSAGDLKSGLARLVQDLAREPGPGTWTRAPLFELLGARCRRDEETHSNILAWLLDPNGSHGLGAWFLTELLSRVFVRDPGPLDHICVCREVEEEPEKADVMVTTDSWRLVIENKIDGGEDMDEAGRGQTERYVERWPGSYCIYLTPHGGPAASKEFRPVHYRLVREILDNIDAPGAVGAFLHEFANHIAWDLEK